MSAFALPSSIRRTFWHIQAFINYEGERYERRERANGPGANLVSSLTEGGLHAPVLDLDVPAFLLPSSTPGHSHLYIDVEMPWRTYRALLRAMKDAGIIEKSFYRGSIQRKQTMVRPPWVKKEKL